MNVDIHADDYSYSLNTSKDIIDCIKSGNLDSFSIMPNMSCFEESMELLYREIPAFNYLPLISIHISIPEGISETGMFPMSWSNLFLNSYSLNKNKVKGQLKIELKHQIEKGWEAIRKCFEIAEENNIEIKQKGMRIDSHIHTHLLPVVWESLIEVIEENNYSVEYIRNPKEPLEPFIKNNLMSYGLVNIIKNRILMLYSGKADKYCDSHNIPKMYMMGLCMSGCMDFDRIKDVYSDMLEIARKDNRNLELLFHPGQATVDEYRPEMDKNYFRDANLSENRHIEKNSVLRIKEIL